MSIRWSEDQLRAYTASLARLLPDKTPKELSVLLPAKPTKTPKYRNTPTAGKASKKEAKRGVELRLMEKAGEITELEEQRKFVLIPAQFVDGKMVERAVTYKSDYSYVRDGKLVVEDCKGFRTQQFVIRRKLMLKVWGIRVLET